MAFGWIAPTSAFGSVVRNPNRSAVTSPLQRVQIVTGRGQQMLDEVARERPGMAGIQL